LFPAWFGSPDSFVAPTFDPAAVPLAPVIAWAFANISFAGGDAALASTVTAHPSAATSATTTVPDRSLNDRR
jgi:hypothetical protein